MYKPKASVAEALNIMKNQTRSIERQDILSEADQKLIDEIQAFVAYVEGATIEDVTEKFDIKPSTFKYKVSKLKAHGIKGFLDQRDNNGSYQEKKIDKLIGQRIIELKIKNPLLGSREIANALKNQDGVEVSHTIVNGYLNEVNLNDYSGSSFRGSLFSPCH